MAEYTPKNWQCGETITAEDLNHMEQGIAEASEGGGCDCGYECTETSTLLTEETVTLADITGQGTIGMGALAYSEIISSEYLKITFNGEIKIAKRQYSASPKSYIYNADDFSLTSYLEQTPTNMVQAGTTGEVSVKVEEFEESITTTDCFNKAVAKANGDKVFYVKATEAMGSISGIDKAPQEIGDAILSGKTVIGKINDNDDEYVLSGAMWHYERGTKKLYSIAFGSFLYDSSVRFAGWGADFATNPPTYRRFNFTNA